MPFDIQLFSQNQDGSTEPVDRPSTRHPQHSIGRFSSKYAPSGHARTFKKLIGQDIFSLLGLSLDSPPTTALDWPKVKERVQFAQGKLAEWKNSGYHTVRSVSTVGSPLSQVSGPKTEEQALAIFNREVAQAKDFELGNFATQYGDFLIASPWRVVGVLPSQSAYGPTTVFLIVEEDISWYIMVLDILEETVDYVLSKGPDQFFYVSWSA